MKARTRTAVTTLALLAAAAGAVAYAYLGVEKKGAEEKERKDQSEKLFSFDRAKVKEVTVAAKGSDVKLVRGPGERWRIVAPVEADADRYTVDALLDKVAALRRKSEVSKDGAKLAAFGLEKPRAMVALRLEGGRTETLAVGDENGFDGSLFVRPTSGEVDLVGGDAKWAIEKGLFDLREKRLLPVDDKDLRAIEVKGAKSSFALSREGEGWKLVRPVAEKADPAEVSKVLSALRSLRASEFIAAPAKEEDLARPRLVLDVSGEGGAKWTFAFGERAAKGNPGTGGNLYARRPGAAEIAVVPSSAVKELEVEPAALRDHAVLSFDVARVTALRLEGPAGAIELQKVSAKPDGGAASAEEKWSITSPRSAPADRNKVASIVSSLSALRATRFADESGKTLSEHGLAPPREAVTLLGEDGRTLARLEIGKEAGDKAFVRTSARPRIDEVEKSRLPALPKGPEELQQPAK